MLSKIVKQKVKINTNSKKLKNGEIVEMCYKLSKMSKLVKIVKSFQNSQLFPNVQQHFQNVQQLSKFHSIQLVSFSYLSCCK